MAEARDGSHRGLFATLSIRDALMEIALAKRRSKEFGKTYRQALQSLVAWRSVLPLSRG
jgi:hypothetical protein